MKIQNNLTISSIKPSQINPSSFNLLEPSIPVRKSSRATFRKFMAEAPLCLQGLQLVQAQSLTPIHHADSTGELRKNLLDSLRNAKSSIECLTFTFSDQEVIELLARKADEGVKVTIAIDKDHMGSLLPYKDKFTLVTRSSGEGRLHHKITVIDEETVWMGSANYSPDALLKQSNTMIQVKSRELADAIHQEMQALLGLRKRDPALLPPFNVEGQTIELLLFPNVPFGVSHSPKSVINELGKKRIIEMINQAKTSLRFAVCVWTDPDLAAAVVRAKRRGVDVEVLLWKEADSLEVQRLFKQEQITVLEKPNFHLMHNKWMLVDNEHFFNGSANWSKSWFSRNDESGLIIHHLNDTQKQGLNAYWEKLKKNPQGA